MDTSIVRCAVSSSLKESHVVISQSLRDSYSEIEPIIRHVRFMRRFMHEVVQGHRESNAVAAALWNAYEDMLNEEYASSVFDLADFIRQLFEEIPSVDPYAQPDNVDAQESEP